MDKTLKQLREEMQVLVDEWDGDEAGDREHKAIAAQDILDWLDNIENALADLEF